MKIPHGFARKGEHRVCRLEKSLYGLRQASQNWFHKFTTSLLAIGFQQSNVDYSLFTFYQGASFLDGLIYVDDVVVIGTDPVRIHKLKQYLDQKFYIKDLGKLKYFLGIEVAWSTIGVSLSQQNYVLDILSESGLLGSKPSSTSMDQQHKLTPDAGSMCVDLGQYRRLVGRLLYLTITHPDISYAVHVINQFMHAPRQPHLDAAFQVLRYLNRAPGQGILLPANSSLTLRAYCDADWAGCPSTWRSTTGNIIFLGSSPISWRSKKQSVVSRSCAEAEYRAMATTSSEIIWLVRLLQDLHVPCTLHVSLFCGNQAAIHIAANPVFPERTKHIEIECHFICQHIQSQFLQNQSSIFEDRGYKYGGLIWRSRNKERLPFIKQHFKPFANNCLSCILAQRLDMEEDSRELEPPSCIRVDIKPQPELPSPDCRPVTEKLPENPRNSQ
ncbi:hypothetical protein RJ639_034877 [Escallonia herrerae]|uniref:Reverse transcriptase Ty1/copia-type domain-containing protein n=1 Tax=Escallonia herrerae TaxID=1293975 RepID=A0AA88WMV4_9ASTE|nr:hypothetical protein RJ639_034877 [Escallonia herrerae]